MSAVRKVNEESLAEAASVIAGGGLVVIPTDTVYGVACDPRNEAAIDRIYQVKSRPRFKALQVRGLHARHGQRHPAGQAYAGHPRAEFGPDPAHIE